MITKLIEKFQRNKQKSVLKKHANVEVGSGLKLGTDNHFILYPKIKKVSLGNEINFRNYIHIIVQNDAFLEIKDHVFLNNNCSINCLEHVSIGENTLFGENVKLYDHNHSYERNADGLKVSKTEFKTAPINIGKNCWLGSNVIILKGVTIGDNSIIGAGCVIYKDIPANSTVVNCQDLNIKIN